jgi:hypothetical protein
MYSSIIGSHDREPERRKRKTQHPVPTPGPGTITRFFGSGWKLKKHSDKFSHKRRSLAGGKGSERYSLGFVWVPWEAVHGKKADRDIPI